MIDHRDDRQPRVIVPIPAGYNFFPYEEVLARREIENLTGTGLDACGALVHSSEWSSERLDAARQRLVERATFVHAVECPGAAPRETLQGAAERRHWELRGSSARRQATRFGVHGLHEYHGKFNPQMVRALVNVVDPLATELLDPFCGSGTTLVEGLRMGLDVAGIDLSPMAAHLARIKIDALSCDAAIILEAFTRLAARVVVSLKVGQYEEVRLAYPPQLDQASGEYLLKWFNPDGASALFRALAILDTRHDDLAADLARLALSGILRSASLQLPEDLRVRRRPPGFVTPHLSEAFREASDRIASALTEIASQNITGRAKILNTSSGHPDACRTIRLGEGRRLIVTSPPYATALPYIDTDRLSIIALGLAVPEELRPLESALVGSREWNRREQDKWTIAFRDNHHQLPERVLTLIRTIETANGRNGAGFRRAAVPVLLYRYFAQMGECFAEWRSYLRPGELAVLVVGHNRTGPKDEQIDINTPALLADVAGTRGYEVVEIMAFEAWPRYGLHSSNGVRGEDALVIRCSSGGCP